MISSHHWDTQLCYQLANNMEESQSQFDDYINYTGKMFCDIQCNQPCNFVEKFKTRDCKIHIKAVNRKFIAITFPL